MDRAPRAPQRRSDAERNRHRILEAARESLGTGEEDVSMAEIARRAGVGMATLYRNFPGRRELLETLYVEEVDDLVRAAREASGSPVEALIGWLRRFTVFHEAKHPIAAEVLRHADASDPMFEGGRARVIAAGIPLLEAAQDAGGVRRDLSLDQILDLVLAATTIRGGADYTAPILDAALNGIRTSFAIDPGARASGAP